MWRTADISTRSREKRAWARFFGFPMLGRARFAAGELTAHSFDVSLLSLHLLFGSGVDRNHEHNSAQHRRTNVVPRDASPSCSEGTRIPNSSLNASHAYCWARVVGRIIGSLCRRRLIHLEQCLFGFLRRAYFRNHLRWFHLCPCGQGTRYVPHFSTTVRHDPVRYFVLRFSILGRSDVGPVLVPLLNRNLENRP